MLYCVSLNGCAPDFHTHFSSALGVFKIMWCKLVSVGASLDPPPPPKKKKIYI